MTDYIVEDIREFQTVPALRAIDAGASELIRAAHAGVPRTEWTQQRALLRLSEAPLLPLTLINAPPGYGKTSLLRQWARELADTGRAPLDIRLHSEHATVLHGAPGQQRAMRSIKHDALTPLIRNWLDTRSCGTILIDDANLLPSTVLHELCAFFLQFELHGHALVLATRSPLPVPLARARALKLVRDIDAGQLRLTDSELHEFADREFGITLATPALTEIMAATGGWPAAVDAYLRRADDIGLAALLRETQRGARLMDDFIAEEILQPLPAELRYFLQGASVLGTLTADLCNEALIVDNGHDLLADIVRAGLFVEAIDGCKQDFRLHPLFATCLQAELLARGRAQHDAIAMRGVAWFERHNRLAEAFECALHAQAWDTAATLLDMFAMRACMAGQGERVTAMALKLPTDVLRRHPRATVFAARGASAGWRFDLVEDFLRLADETDIRNGSAEVEGLVLHSRMLTAQYEDNQILAEQKCLELLKRIDVFDHTTRGIIFGSLLYARREQFDFASAAELEATGVREFNLGGRTLGMVWHLSVVGPTYAMRGDLTTATRRLQEASIAASRLEDAEWIASVPALLQAEICYERNDLASAYTLIERYRSAPPVGIIDQYVAGYVTGARLLWLGGDIAAAHRRLDEGVTLAESRSLDRLRQSMIGERIRLLLACGEQERAIEIGRQEKLLGGLGAMLPRPHCTTRDEIRAISWFRLAVIHGRTVQAVELGLNWKRFTAKVGANRSTMRWELLLARAYAAEGQSARAQRELRNALARAVTGGFVRSFLDEGEPIVQLLRDQFNASRIQTGAIDLLVTQLLEASEADCRSKAEAIVDRGNDKTQPNAGRLTRTQVEILQMASAGLQNREIAQRIGMTEGSVKWYMQQIFNKIGIRKRAGALDRAKALGLA